jgi:branched-chain amino acid transport system substrate-binding protein
MQYIYRLFLLLCFFVVTSCTQPPEDAKILPKNLPIKASTISEKPYKPQPKPEKTIEKTISDVNNAVKAPKPEDEFAPATKIAGGDDEKQVKPIIPDANYAPATQIGEAAKTATVKVGFLIPMSGESSELGKSLLDAAVLAIYDKYSTISSRDNTAKIELLPKDTGDSIENAERAAQEAIAEGAEIIIGPLFSRQVSGVAAIAKNKKVPVITFSNNVSVAGDGVYIFGFTPEQQVTRIVQYYIKNKNSNIAAIVPSTPYGAAIIKQLSTEVRKKGSRVQPIEYYSEDMASLDKNIIRLSRYLQEEQSKGQSLFIAEGGDKLKILTDNLAYNGITASNVQYIGTGLWDDVTTLKLPHLYGAWFASSPPDKYQEFEKYFVKTYNYKPDRRASLSYDATALIINIALSSGGKGFPKNIITDQVGFNGPANGIFRFRDDGVIERGLSILMITANGFKTVEPAPSSFNE